MNMQHHTEIGGEVRRWKEGKILFAENWVMRAAYVVTRDKRKVGCVGWYGKTPTWVEFIRPEDATAWDSVVNK